VAALGALKKLVALAPKALGDDVSRDVILAAVKESDEAGEAVFALLEGTPGPEAVDVIYELSNLKEPKPVVAARAQKLIAKPEIKDRASPALKALITLKAAKGCEANYAALADVKENGDARTLPLLKLLLNRSGCSSLFRTADCNPCLRKDKLLDETIAAVEKRKLPTRVGSVVRVKGFGDVALGPEPVFERVGAPEANHSCAFERCERDQAVSLFVRELARRVCRSARRFDVSGLVRSVERHVGWHRGRYRFGARRALGRGRTRRRLELRYSVGAWRKQQREAEIGLAERPGFWSGCDQVERGRSSRRRGRGYGGEWAGGAPGRRSAMGLWSGLLRGLLLRGHGHYLSAR
jgi:hypothetical protein